MAATPNNPVRPSRLLARDSSIGAQEDFSPIGYIDPTRTPDQGGWGQPSGAVAIAANQHFKVGVIESVGYTAFSWVIPASGTGGSFVAAVGVPDPLNPGADLVTTQFPLSSVANNYNANFLVTWGNIQAAAGGGGLAGGQLSAVLPYFSLYIVDQGTGGSVGGLGRIFACRP